MFRNLKNDDAGKPMFHSYDEIFNKRGNAYHDAMRLAPLARKKEFEIALSGAEIVDGDVLCDLPSGGGYLADHLPRDLKLRYIAIDPAEVFARKMQVGRSEWHLAPLGKIPVKNDAADVLVSIAGLHHVEDRISVFREMRRILRIGGRLSILEIPKGAITDDFLNDFVDRHNSMGHDGNFVDDQFRADLCEAGFTIIKDELRKYSWDFTDEQSMIEFIRLMFWLDKASRDEIREGVEKYLGVTSDQTGCRFNWELQSIVAV